MLTLLCIVLAKNTLLSVWKRKVIKFDSTYSKFDSKYSKFDSKYSKFDSTYSKYWGIRQKFT